MGTQLDLLLVGDDETLLGEVWREIERLIVALERQLSRFDKEGELYNLNNEAIYDSVELSETLWEVLSDCAKYNKLTNGYFDISLGRSSYLVLDERLHSAYFIDETMSLDLGAYGKGYTLDRIWLLLKAKGIRNAFVNFGNSSILALGHHPCGDNWDIAVTNPYSGESLAEFSLCDSTLTVSGNTPSHEGHIVDPRSGERDMRRRVVAIESRDPKLAEVLTTSMMLMSDEESEELYNKVKEKIVSRYIKDL